MMETPKLIYNRTLDEWNTVRSEETRLLRAISPGEGARRFFALMAEFEPWLQESEHLYREKRDQAMIQLQSRLASLKNRP
ncbi:MAG: hypothetical protein AB1649_15900 [Chloroflexota bacterium]